MTASEVKSFLKDQGIPTTHIRVSAGSSLEVRLLDKHLNLNQIQNLLREKYETIDRDQASGEILSGGNTFVFVEFQEDLFDEVAEELRSQVREFLHKCSGPWEVQGLVRHYMDSEEIRYDRSLIKRAVERAIRQHLRDEGLPQGLSVDGF